MGQTNYKHLVISRSEFFKLVRALNESLRLIILYFMFEYTFVIKTTLLESLRRQKKPFEGSITAKLVIMTLF